MVIQKLKLENELENETLTEEAAMTNDTVEILGQLFDTSGCKKQICETCDIAMVDPKDFKESNWYCMQARVKVEYRVTNMFRYDRIKNRNFLEYSHFFV